jgi:hypothetical protein
MLRVVLFCFFVISLDGAEVRWLHLSSATNHIPLPSTAKLQTGSVVADFDGDKTNDFILAFADAAPALVLYRAGTNGVTNWTTLPIELNQLPIASGGAAVDIDDDGDLDVIFGSESGPELWWWENPRPAFNPQKSWTRRVIRAEGGATNRGQLIADLLGTGRPQLLFWNQSSNAIYHVPIPTEARAQTNWITTQLFTPRTGTPGVMQTLTALDLNIDGSIDLLAGNYWLKRENAFQFTPTRIGSLEGRSAIGRFRQSTFPQVVIAPLATRGRVFWYECKTQPDKTESWAGRQLLGHEIAPAASLAIGDIDRDGNDDILLSERREPSQTSTEHSPNAWIFYSDGFGNFHSTLFNSDLEMFEAKLADLDNDGDLDILSTPHAANTPRVDIWLNVTDLTGARTEPKDSRAGSLQQP